MRVARSIHLLVAAAILFSQIVSGVHMAGHVHATTDVLADAAVSATASELAAHSRFLTPAEHQALHQKDTLASADNTQAQAIPDLSCVIYHVYAGSHCAVTSPAIILVGTVVAIRQPDRQSPVRLTPQAEHNFIRGPPAFSLS